MTCRKTNHFALKCELVKFFSIILFLINLQKATYEINPLCDVNFFNRAGSGFLRHSHVVGILANFGGGAR